MTLRAAWAPSPFPGKVGDTLGFGHDYNARYPFNDLSAYDPATGQWQEVTWLDSGFRTSAFCFLLGDDLYIGGGTRDSGRTALTDFHQYNLRTRTWVKRARLPFRQATGACAVVCRDTAYLLGGCTASQCETHLWSYNREIDRWDTGAALPVKAAFPVAFVLEGELYYGLGSREGAVTSADFWKIAPGTGAAWQRIRSFTDQRRTLASGIAVDSMHAVVGLGFRMEGFLAAPITRTVINGKLVQDAYRNESGYMTGDFWLYNSRKNKWKRLPAQRLGRRGAVSFVIGHYLYCGMGNAENKITKDVYRLDLSRFQ